ncbi:MAG: DNA gyrase inhibitor YacG [Novosphingobium sp.]|uniref:DNA gyrase inhibitor YacG n=1 Tax=Novosphingobium sp. TaxID=1874826 RepID=UPI00301A4B37
MTDYPLPSPPRRCPICRKPRVAEFTPFCSTRCRDRDLVNWLEEGYALPGPVQDPEGDLD